MAPQDVTFNNLPEAISQLLSTNLALMDKVHQLSIKVDELSGGKEILDVEQAAKFINKTLPALYTMVYRREIKFHKPDKNLQFFRADLLEWVRNGKQSASNNAAVEIRKNIVALNKK